jgi:hypothetical protein
MAQNPKVDDVKTEQDLINELHAQLTNFWLLAFIIVSIVVFSSWFYHVTEKWNWLDSVYYVVVTLGTVGYGDFVPTTDIGKIYTMFLIVGVITTFGVFAQQLIKRQQLRTLKRQLRHVEKLNKD